MTDFVVWRDLGVALVEPSGALNISTFHQLRTALHEAAMLTSLPAMVVVDGAVTQVDGVAIAALLIENRRLRQRHGSLAVVGTRGPIARLLRETPLAEQIRVFDRIESALTELTAPKPPE